MVSVESVARFHFGNDDASQKNRGLAFSDLKRNIMIGPFGRKLILDQDQNRERERGEEKRFFPERVKYHFRAVLAAGTSVR